MFKVGDVIALDGYPHKYRIDRVNNDGTYSYTCITDKDAKGKHTFGNNYKILYTIKGNNMLKEIGSDVQQFVKDNRNVVYTIALVVLVDHFVFGGSFREKLKQMMDKLLNKCQEKLDQKAS